MSLSRPSPGLSTRRIARAVRFRSIAALIAFLALACASAEKEYLAARAAPDKEARKEALKAFIEKYPEDAKARNAAGDIELIDFEYATDKEGISLKQQIERMERFLIQYPKGELADRVSEELQNTYYVFAIKEDSRSAYSSFIRRYPKSDRTNQMRKRLEIYSLIDEFVNAQDGEPIIRIRDSALDPNGRLYLEEKLSYALGNLLEKRAFNFSSGVEAKMALVSYHVLMVEKINDALAALGVKYRGRAEAVYSQMSMSDQQRYRDSLNLSRMFAEELRKECAIKKGSEPARALACQKTADLDRLAAIAANDAKPIVYGRTPDSASAKMNFTWEPLTRSISNQLGRRIDFHFSDTYDSLLDDLRQEKIDLVNVGALQYYLVKDLYEPVAKVERRGKCGYSAVIFARNGLGVNTLADLRSHSVMLVNKNSTSGYLYPVVLLAQNDLLPGRDYTISFAGSHDKVALGVLEGKADAGACYEDCRLVTFGSKSVIDRSFVTLGKTEMIPADPILLRKSLDPELKEKLRQAIVNAGLDSAIMARISQYADDITGLQPASESDYEPLARALEKYDEIKRQAGLED